MNHFWRWKKHYAGETFTPNADINIAKCLFSSVISTKFTKFLDLDIKDFYLNTNMDQYEYMWLPQWIPPQDFIDENQIEHLFIDNRILAKIRKSMYGLPQEGLISYIALIKHL